MFKKRTAIMLAATLCLFAALLPQASFAADGGDASAAVSAAVSAAAAALTGQGTDAGAGAGDIVLTSPSEGGIFGGDTDAETSEVPATAIDSLFTDPSLSEPDTTIVNETLSEEDRRRNPATTSSPEASTTKSSALDPREVRGSTMYDNLRGRLNRFGADFFATRRTNTLTYAPVGPNYIVAPGDEVRITLWGYDDIRANLIVDRDGVLTLPKAGPINAGGMAFEDLEKAVEKAYDRIISDFEINVSMGKLHTINVYVTGHAARPGAYAVSSMATLIDVISQAGGPALSGTMRAIEVKRNDKTIATLDVYELLLNGSRKGDERLRDGDVIFIPTVGTLVSAAGNVKRPAVYELTKGETKLKDIINLAGGLTSGAFTGRYQIVRVSDNTIRTAFESELSEARAAAQELQDGDLVKIFAVPGGSINVRIAGAVIQPGVYAIVPGTTTLGDVLNRAGGLLYTAAAEGELTRIEVSEHGPVTTRMMVNLLDAIEGKNNLLLQRDDYIFVRTVPDWNLYRSAQVTGRVLYPGNYAVKQGERLSSLLERAGGFAEDAFPRGAIFIRDSVRVEQQKNIDEMILRLEREMASAANKAVSTAATTKDVTFAEAEVTQKDRLMTALRNLKATGRVIIQIPSDYRLIKGSAYDVVLQDGDRLHIPAVPGTVQVIGSVTAQSTFVYREGQPISEYIRMAGGFSASANAKRTYIMKPDGSTIRAFSGKHVQKVEDGDFIVVPEKLMFQPTMRNATDIVDIVYKMVIGVAAVDYIFD